MTHVRLIALALASVASSPLMANDLDWRISEASGNVQLLHAGLSKAAARGGLVQPGDTIVTGRGARAVVTRGEEYLMIAPSSQLRLPAAEQSGTVTKIFQDVGNVVFMIKKKLTPHFAVSTPYLAAVVKGTTFSVSVTDTGTSVQVIEGAVDVATADGGAHDLLKPGAVAMVSAGDRYRLRIEGDGAARTIQSPAMPARDPAPQAPAATAAPVVAESAAPRQDVIATAIVESPVSLAETTGGLVNGTIGGEVQTQFAMASEGSRAAADTIQAAAASATASQIAQQAETARAEAASVKANAVEAVKAAEQASDTAEQSAKAAAEAAAAKAAGDAAAAAAAAQAAQAAEQARAAAAEAARAADETAARQAKEAAAAAAALEAQRVADLARQNAADAAALDAANKAAEAAAKEAQQASEHAAQAEADRLAREAARLEADKQAMKAAEAAAKAAEQAQAKAAEQAAREAAKAADDAAREQAKQLAEAAAAAEQAAKQAADQVAKAAEQAAKEAEQAAKEAVKIADVAAESRGAGGPGPSSGPPEDQQDHSGKGNDEDHSGKGRGPVESLKDVLTASGKGGGKGKN